MTVTTDTRATEAPDVFVTSYAVVDGAMTARVVYRDGTDPMTGRGAAWLVDVQGRWGVSLADRSNGGNEPIGLHLDTVGEIPAPPDGDGTGQLALALGYARELLDFYREHDARLEKALAESAAHLHRIRTAAGCVDR